MIPDTLVKDRYNVRPFERSDIEVMVSLCKGMLDEGALHKLEYDERKVEAWFRTVHSTPKKYMHRVITTIAPVSGEYLVDRVVGVFVFCIDTPFFAKNAGAYDCVVYIDPKHRGATAFRSIAIINEYKQWARKSGAKEIFLGISSGINEAVADRLYTSLNFVRIGGMYALGAR